MRLDAVYRPVCTLANCQRWTLNRHAEVVKQVWGQPRLVIWRSPSTRRRFYTASVILRRCCCCCCCCLPFTTWYGYCGHLAAVSLRIFSPSPALWLSVVKRCYRPANELASARDFLRTYQQQCRLSLPFQLTFSTLADINKPACNNPRSTGAAKIRDRTGFALRDSCQF